MLVGIKKPLLFLPHENYSDEEIEFVLMHELIHFKRHDILFKNLLLIVNAIHWFNPLVWFMVREASRDIEISCDDVVVKKKGISYRKRYCEAILNVIQKRSNQSVVLTTNFIGGKNDLKSRFINILNMDKKQRGFLPLCLVIVMIGAVTILTGCLNFEVNNDSAHQENKYSTIEDSIIDNTKASLINDIESNDSEVESKLNELDLAEQLAEEQARILEIILFYGVGENQYVIDTDENTWKNLLNKVSNKALEKESYKYLQETRLEYDRAFYTDVIGVKLNTEQDKLIYTMLANLTQGLSREFTLEVYMIKENGEWKFEDFGSLYVEEYFDYPSKYIEDETFLDNYKDM